MESLKLLEGIVGLLGSVGGGELKQPTPDRNSWSVTSPSDEIPPGIKLDLVTIKIRSPLASAAPSESKCA